MYINNPTVLILIVNWNKKDYVVRLLNSLENLNYKNYEVLVVDNDSTDDSVEVLRLKFPHIKIIKNKENLGGTGGFNTGLYYALENKDNFKYVWLLDNDAEIEPDTLYELVKVMEEDNSVGLAGSRIKDADNRDITLEVGSFFKWNTIGVTPNLRNKRVIINKEPVEVDYVAVCSALCRIEALEKVGVMDARLFIFWDDMDWGLYFKENGYKVKAVPSSLAYHASFTERDRGALTDYYYGIRNSLLVYSKHTNAFRRFFIFYRYFRNTLKSVFLLFMNDRKYYATLTLQAIWDFCNNKWGKYTFDKLDKLRVDKIVKLQSETNNPTKILIMGDGDKNTILSSKKEIENEFPNSVIELLVTNDRVDVYEPYFEIIHTIDSNRLHSLFYNIKVLKNVIYRNYDICVNTFFSPYCYGVKNTFNYKTEVGFSKSNMNIANIYKPVIAFIVGEISALFVTPLIFLLSYRYGDKT